MILGMEVVLTLAGFYMLIMGKGWGKNSPSHWQFRLLGGFVLTLLPVALVAMIIMGVVWALKHPHSNPDTLTAELRWPATGVEFAIVVVYAIAATLWDKAIRRKIAPAAPPPTSA